MPHDAIAIRRHGHLRRLSCSVTSRRVVRVSLRAWWEWRVHNAVNGFNASRKSRRWYFVGEERPPIQRSTVVTCGGITGRAAADPPAADRTGSVVNQLRECLPVIDALSNFLHCVGSCGTEYSEVQSRPESSTCSSLRDGGCPDRRFTSAPRQVQRGARAASVFQMEAGRAVVELVEEVHRRAALVPPATKCRVRWPRCPSMPRTPGRIRSCCPVGACVPQSSRASGPRRLRASERRRRPAARPSRASRRASWPR